MPNFGKIIEALLIRTISWSLSPAGSYWILMPSAETFTTSGTSISSAATLKPNLPGSSTRKLPLNSPNASTARSNVPSTPIRSAVIPLSPCADEVELSLLPLPPKLRVARSTPIPIVRTSNPSLKPISSIPILGPCNCSGPRLIGLSLLAAPGANGSSVKLCLRPLRFWVLSSVENESFRNSIVT